MQFTDSIPEIYKHNFLEYGCEEYSFAVRNLIIPGADKEDAIDKLELVLERVKKWSWNGLEINKRKCRLLQRFIEFLGHIIEDNYRGKLYFSDKTKAVQKFSKLRTIKKVQNFLGFTGYCRKFIPCYSKITTLLNDLLKKNLTFRFEEPEKNAFKLKRCLSEKLLLNIYNCDYETEVHTDASRL